MLREIGDYCFGWSCLEELNVPPGVKKICCGVFGGCVNLKRVILNEGLEALKDY